MLTVPPPAFDTVVEAAVDRLSIEFTDVVPPPAVRTAVVIARAELSADPPAALPELVERLARARLLEVLEQSGPAHRGRCTSGR